MPLEIDPELARERINEFLEQIDELMEKRYDEGKEEKMTMSTKLDNFAKVAFTDGEGKKESLHPVVMSATWGRKNPRKKQKEYEESLKRKKRNLEAWKEQIDLEEGMTRENGDESNTYAKIEEEISKIEEELPIYASDLEKSIEELRSGHLLASAMITGRVIDHTIDQIKSSQHLGDPEEVLDYLEDNGIVDPTESKITDSVKSYRDIYAHEVGKIPDFNETLIILLGCAKLLYRIKDAGKAREYDLA